MASFTFTRRIMEANRSKSDGATLLATGAGELSFDSQPLPRGESTMLKESASKLGRGAVTLGTGTGDATFSASVVCFLLCLGIGTGDGCFCCNSGEWPPPPPKACSRILWCIHGLYVAICGVRTDAECGSSDRMTGVKPVDRRCLADGVAGVTAECSAAVQSANTDGLIK